jgi:glutathione synthase/RimK-type ligase-like ATP-grasp enzyme
LPHIEEAIEIVKKAASLMPGLRLVGWDVGFSDEGPVIIEGNSDYGINSNDLMYGGYLKNEKFMEVLMEFEGR